MGRNLFLSALILIAGFCLGILSILAFTDFASPPTAAETLPLPSAQTADLSDAAVRAPGAEAVLAQADPEDNRFLLSLAMETADALKNRDYAALSRLAHPADGVLFVPYSTVEPQVNLTFTPAQLAALEKDTTKYVWGIWDGRGDPLELTAADYFDRFVYNADYVKAPILGIDRVVGTGNALENVSEVFPDARFVEFYFPGLAPEYEGFDWCGLKLVFTRYQEEYKLRAVIHSEWTI